MSRDKAQSAIREVRDQLFLDTADGLRLNIVTGNLGLDRPLTGVDDDTWRSLAKQIALKPKLVTNVFHRVMEACVGPQNARIASIGLANEAGESVVEMVNAADLLQVGTLIFSPGLVNEETVKFCFRDLVSNRVFLESELTNVHPELPEASSFVAVTATVASGSLTIRNDLNFPDSGFPWAVIVDRGKPTQEILSVSNHVSGTGILTLSSPTTQPHATAKSRNFLRRALDEAIAAKRDFLQMDQDATRDFPLTGWLRLDFGLGTEEVVEYTNNDVANNLFELKTPLAFAHTAGASVELVDPGATVEIVSVMQEAVDWSIHQTNPRQVQIYLPASFSTVTNRDASYLHDVVPAAASTTTNKAASIGDTSLFSASFAGFPKTGMVLVNGTDTHMYTFQGSELLSVVGGTVDVSDPAEGVQVMTAAAGTFNADMLGQSVDVTSADVSNNEGLFLILAVSRDGDELSYFNPVGTAGAAITVTYDIFPEMRLTVGLASAYGGGTSLDLIRVIHPGTTELEDGNPRQVSGVLNVNRWPGPYLYSPTEYAPTQNQTTLETPIPPPTRVRVNQSVGRDSLEVADATAYPTTFPYPVRLGRLEGFSEDTNVRARTLKLGNTLVVSGTNSAGSTIIPATAATTGFPPSTTGVPSGYRIIIDRGGPNEEIVFVHQNDVANTQFILTAPTANDHDNPEVIELLNDVLTTDQLVEPRRGFSVNPTFNGDGVEPLVSQLRVLDAAQFPATSGTLFLNFGKGRLDVRTRIATVVNPTTIEFADSSIFPQVTGPGYYIQVGVGLPHQETKLVTLNDTGTDRLTVSPALVGTFVAGDYVEFKAGTPVTLSFDDTDTLPAPDAIDLTTPTVLPSGYTHGESVLFSAGFSQSSNTGYDFPFLMPPDAAACLRLVMDLVRAAGVEVIFLSDR